MSCNIMNEYIKLIKKDIIRYLRLILEDKYDQSICESYLNTYIEIRYYDMYNSKIYTRLKKNVIEGINNKKEKLISIYPEKEENIKITRLFFNYVIYLDNINLNKNINRAIEYLNRARFRVLGKGQDSFSNEIIETIKNNIARREDFLKKFETNEFFIKVVRYTESKDTYRVNLNYKFKLPVLYSGFAIDKAFNTGTTNEDKLFVEYSLITARIIEDIAKGNFKKQYIVEFAESLLEKHQKIETLLNIIDNSAIHDKLSLKIKYSTFLNNKEQIYELINRGIKIAVIIDNTIELEYSDIDRLEVFKYILINPDCKYYDTIIKDKVTLQKIIKI